MPSNPLQRKTRNSFLLGMLITLLVVALIGGLIFMLVIKPKIDKQKAEEAVPTKVVYKLTTNVKSGDEVSSGMLQQVTLPASDVPVDAINAPISGIAKINLTQGTIISEQMLTERKTDLDNSLRLVEYNMIMLPITISAGETVDVRISFPNGQDLIVVSNKVVQGIDGQTISLYMTEAEILLMNSAIVEAWTMTAGNLYLTRYTDPGIQTAATITYAPTEEVQNLIAGNPNIVNEVKNSLASRFGSGIREYINQEISQYSSQSLLNIEAGLQEQIEAARTARENYLSGMSGN